MTGSNVALDISSVVGSVDNTLPLNFGGDGLTQRNLDGKLDEIHVFNSALNGAEINSIIATSPVDVHYKLEGDLTDSGSNGLDAAWNGASGLFVTGAIGSGIDIEDSTAEFVTVADNPLLNFGTNSFTVMFWTEFDKNIQPTQPRIVNNWDLGPGFLLFEKDGKMRVRVEDNLGNFKAGTFNADIGNNVFHHVALVVDRNTNEVRLYTDGIQTMTGSNVALDISSVVGSVDNTLPLNFGGDGLTQRNLDGKLDEIQVIQRVLTDVEILSAATIP